jgi:hypothetical protein
MPMKDILESCLQEYGDISEKKYPGKRFDLKAIENEVHKRKLHSKRTLTYADLQFFEAKEHWWFEKFWVFPPEHTIHPALQERTFDFWNLPKNDANLIADLLDVFKSIELVSIALRFIKPEYYGIISPPVERVLDVRRGSNAVETYRNYVDNLREIAEHFGFERRADVDMALWVLFEKCFGHFRDREIELAYRNDPTFLRIRTRNLVLPLVDISPARLAEALPPEMQDLAAIIACKEFEKQIRKMARLLDPDLASQDLKKIIQDMPGPISSIRRGNWDRFRKVRNNFFHYDRHPTEKETLDLVREVIEIERDLDNLQQLGK